MQKELVFGKLGAHKIRIVTLRHTCAGGSSSSPIYTGVAEFDMTEYTPLVVATPDSHSTSNQSGSFDFTIPVTDDTSIRFHSDGVDYNKTYMLYDVIKNGTTVSSANRLDLQTQTYYGYVVSLFIN